MENGWKRDVSNLLKCLEVERPQIHGIRRSFESSQEKKCARILPQIEEIYRVCEPNLNNEGFFEWMNGQGFILKFGQRSVKLVVETLTPEYKSNFVWMLSRFNPDLDRREKHEKMGRSGRSGAPISRKKIKAAMKMMDGMDEDSLNRLASRVPPDEVKRMAADPKMREMVDRLRQE